MSLPFRERPVPPSPLARWDARWKLAGLLALGFGFAALEGVGPSAAALAAAALLLAVGRVSWRCVAARAGLVLLAVGLPLALLPFTSPDGTRLAASLALRASAVAGVALVLLRTGPVPHTFAAASRLGLPGVLVQVAQLAHRYAALFQSEFFHLRRALRARGFAPGTNARTAAVTGQAVGTLFVRGIDRAEAVAGAMRARGFDGRYRTLDPFRTSVADVAGLAACLLAAIGLIAWDRLA